MTVSTASIRVCVVGSGTRFLSGISYYTHRLACELHPRHEVSVILMRRLLPRRLYPGRERVGKELAQLGYPPDVQVLDGVDWYWFPSIVRALMFLVRRRPDVVVLQWWTGTVLHSYLALAVVARARGGRLVVELHEVQDIGELGVPLAGLYVRTLFPLLVRLADGFVVHSTHDLDEVRNRNLLRGRPVEVIRHGPYDRHRHSAPKASPAEADEPRPFELLSFGVIRPFKGVEDLVAAFDLLSEAEAETFRLTIVGETWEGWTLPGEMVERSRYRDRITFVNRYVADEEVGRFFAAADAVVLPYHRSSASGPLHIAMSHGLPVVVSAVGGLVESAAGYDGARFVPPKQPAALRTALLEVRSLRGRRFRDPRSWGETISAYEEVFRRVAVARP